jgi:hypothetical protein
VNGRIAGGSNGTLFVFFTKILHNAQNFGEKD